MTLPFFPKCSSDTCSTSSKSMPAPSPMSRAWCHWKVCPKLRYASHQYFASSVWGPPHVGGEMAVHLISGIRPRQVQVVPQTSSSVARLDLGYTQSATFPLTRFWSIRQLLEIRRTYVSCPTNINGESVQRTYMGSPTNIRGKSVQRTSMANLPSKQLMKYNEDCGNNEHPIT